MIDVSSNEKATEEKWRPWKIHETPVLYGAGDKTRTYDLMITNSIRALDTECHGVSRAVISDSLHAMGTFHNPLWQRGVATFLATFEMLNSHYDIPLRTLPETFG